MAVARIRANGRSNGHAGPVRRGHAYRGQTPQRHHPRGTRLQRHAHAPGPLLAGMLDNAPRAAAILVAAVLAFDLVRILLMQPVR